MTNNSGNNTPWFGPKRVGWGLRPQTWQGWALTAALVLAILLVAWLTTGNY